MWNPICVAADGKLGCLLGTCASSAGGAIERSRRSSRTSGAKNGGGGSGGEGGEGGGNSEAEEPAVFTILHLEPGYPAASILRQGDALLGVNGCRVEPGNTEHALALIRQASMTGAPVTATATRIAHWMSRM